MTESVLAVPAHISMTPQEFIEARLQELKLSASEIPGLKSEKDLADFIFKSVMSKKFRKYRMDPETAEHIRGAIELNIQKEEPIKIVLSFGGYKLWRLEEAPEPDWAELFSMIYYTRWLKPILSAYAPGVWFDFVTDGVILEKMNNIPKEDSEAYHRALSELINFITPYLPSNLKFTITPIRDFYGSDEEFESDLEDKISKLKKELQGGLPKLSEKDAERIELNVKLKPGQSEDPLWKEKVQLMHNAYMTVSKKRPYYNTNDKFMVMTTPHGGKLALGTTKNSIAKFWTGIGALKIRDDKFIETVLSPSQLLAAKYAWGNIHIKGLEGKNWKKVRIIE